MKVLYITFDNPAVQTIMDGFNDQDLWGLPALYYPLKKLLERKHMVDMLLITDKKYGDGLCNKAVHFNIIQAQVKPKKEFGIVQLPIKIMSTVKHLHMKNHYDFIYGMGEGTYPGIIMANRLGVPCALRQFGTQEMANVLETIKGNMYRLFVACTRYPYITCSMYGKMSFLLATNDGSRTNELYDLLNINKKRFKFFFWHSGIEIPEHCHSFTIAPGNSYPKTYDKMHLSCIGRITEVKRQDRCIRILKELHEKGFPMHLHFVGYVSEIKMKDTITELADKFELGEYIHYEGKKTQEECREYARNSGATLLTAEWNRVNIFYEVMSEGSLVLTNNNHSIDEFIDDRVNCILFDENDYVQAAEKLIATLEDSDLICHIRQNAYQTAKQRFLSSEKRFNMEVDLIESTVNGKSLDCFPEII